MDEIVVYGSFDDVRSLKMRFLEEAAGLGALTVLLWSDETIQAVTGKPPRFPAAERQYFLEAVRYVQRVIVAPGQTDPQVLPLADPACAGLAPAAWALLETEFSPATQAWCAAHGVRSAVIALEGLADFPPPPEMDLRGTPGRKKVLVTGCYDWLHSGHVRFFEEASAYGDLYVVVGNDANVRNLKGAGHPLFPQDLRRYMAGAMRFVHQALITSGWGWMDAEPEVIRLRPEIYLVNEDGDRPEKQAFCSRHGLEYVVLKRLPRPGLPARSSTDLRGF